MMAMAPPTGVKRHATDDLDHSQRLAKRFELLDLKHNGRPHKIAAAPTPPPRADSMELENTKHKVYVHDLDRELEEIESDEERPVFLSDIEKHLMKIPKHVLQDDHSKKMAEDMQLVLYGAPISLTVSEENDSVRRAIIDSRRRAQLNQPFTVPDANTAFPSSSARLTPKYVGNQAISQPLIDPDAMEIG